MIRTKSIYEPKANEDGFRVLVTRYYPRGVKKSNFDQWVRGLSPNPELLKIYKSGEISWDKFESKFRNQMDANHQCIEMIQTLAHLATIENVTLLCYEKNGNPCHRYLVEELIQNKMSQIPELLTKAS